MSIEENKAQKLLSLRARFTLLEDARDSLEQQTAAIFGDMMTTQKEICELKEEITAAEEKAEILKPLQEIFEAARQNMKQSSLAFIFFGDVFHLEFISGESAEENTVFLMYGTHCVGSAERVRKSGYWSVTVSKEYDPLTDSDSAFVGEFSTRELAIYSLWEARHDAYVDNLKVPR